MKRSLFSRQLAFSAGLILLNLLLLGFSFSLISYRYVLQERRSRLDETARTVAEMAVAVHELNSMEDWQLNIQITSLSRATGNHIFICDFNGNVWACSDSFMLQCEHIGKRLSTKFTDSVNRQELTRLNSDLDGFYSSKQFISAAAITASDGSRLGTAIASTGRGDVSRIWSGFALVMLYAAVFVLIICVPVAVLFTRHETAPLKEMANAARQFAKGELSVRVTGHGRMDEVGELAEAFNQMAESLEKAEKNRMDFVANVSHELKTPMTTISGYADGLLDGTIPMDQAQKYLSVIASETKRLSRLVRQMLNISRMKDGSVLRNGSFDVTETLRMAIISLDAKISAKQLQLRPEIPEDALRIRGNEDAISQVIINILDNAVKFAEAGSPLDIRLFKQSGRAYLSIIDRGETIPEDELSSIFQRFHKSDRSRSLDRDGVGLGLYIVKTILDSMGEDIWVRSANGETEFRFSLTLSD